MQRTERESADLGAKRQDSWRATYK